MQCHDFEERLNELLDRRQTPAGDRLLTAHARRCPACRQMAAAYQLLAEETAAATPECSPDLASRIAGRWQQSAVVRFPVSWAAGWSVAAAVLVTLLWHPWTMLPRAPEQRSVPEVATTILEAPESTLASNPAGPLPASVPIVPADDSSQDYWQLAAATGESLSQLLTGWQGTLLSAEVPPVAPGAATSPAVQPNAPTDQLAAANSPAEANSWTMPVSTAATGGIWHLASGLRPVADSTAGAMSFLWNSLPQSQSLPADDAAPTAAGRSDST